MKKTLFAMFALVAVGLLGGCAGTKAAYQAADSLDDTAYVVTEHYAAVVHEAADLREQGVLAGAALARVQAADNAVAPLVRELKTASDAYAAVKNAETTAELQAAVAAAVEKLSAFIDAVKRR